MHGCRGVCMVAGGHAWLQGGRVWLQGACMVAGECVVARGSCDLSHHAFDVTCMLPPHQLSVSTCSAPYIV